MVRHSYTCVTGTRGLLSDISQEVDHARVKDDAKLQPRINPRYFAVCFSANYSPKISSTIKDYQQLDSTITDVPLQALGLKVFVAMLNNLQMNNPLSVQIHHLN